MCMSVEYYRNHRKHFESQVTVEVTVATTRVPGQPSTLFVNPVNGSTVTTHVPSPEYDQLSHRLFWISLLSTFVSVVCAIALFVLVFTSRSSKVRRSARTLRSRSVFAIPSAAPAEVRVRPPHDDVDDDANADGYNELTSVIVSRE